MSNWRIQPLEGRPYQIYVRFPAEPGVSVTEDDIVGDRLVERFARRTNPAERIYLEWPAESPVSLEPLRSTLASLRSAGLLDNTHSTGVTLETDVRDLADDQRDRLTDVGVTRIVTRMVRARFREVRGRVGALDKQFDLSVEIPLDEVSSLSSRGLAEELRGPLSQLSLPHISFDMAEKTDGIPQAELLDHAANQLQRLGLRRLSETTFGSPGRESPMMAHIRAGGEYLGIGTGAASMHLEPEGVVRSRRADGSQAPITEVVGPSDHLRELTMLQFPTDRGVSPGAVIQRIPALGAEFRQALTRQIFKEVDRGTAREVVTGRFRPAPGGWQGVDATIERLWEAVDRASDSNE